MGLLLSFCLCVALVMGSCAGKTASNAASTTARSVRWNLQPGPRWVAQLSRLRGRKLPDLTNRYLGVSFIWPGPSRSLICAVGTHYEMS
jgi:hypothetical protein